MSRQSDDGYCDPEHTVTGKVFPSSTNVTSHFSAENENTGQIQEMLERTNSVTEVEAQRDAQALTQIPAHCLPK